MTKSFIKNINSKGRLDIINITDIAHDLLKKSGIENGVLVIFIPGSTGAISTMEYEPGLIADVKELLNKIAPYGKPYAHHNTWHDDNGSSHLLSFLLKTDFSVPIVDGKLTLGTWQQIVFVELDTRPRHRRLVFQFVGD